MRTDAWTDPIPITDVGGVWVFPEQAILYTQTSKAVPTPEDVDALIDFYLWLGPHVTITRAPTLIHDWRALQSVPRKVRNVFVRRRREMSQRPERVVIAVTLNPVLRMALRSASLAAQLLMHAVELDLVEDPMPALRALGAGEPDPNLHSRLRLAWKLSRA